jgi:NADPH-dependent 2,4-dienoyl-CoA reductase/sulfur reductase-like enzyme
METHRYLIVGGGMAGHAAAGAIRERDRDGAIAMLGEEPHPPYARPPLSKGLWMGRPRDEVFLSKVEGLIHLAGRRAVALDPARREVRDDRGGVHRYEALLLATGGRPRRLADDGGRVVYLRTIDDYDRLRAVAGDELAVIGGGFIGSEIAASLRGLGKRVTMIFPEEHVGARVYPAELAAFLDDYYAGKGVRVLSGHGVASVEAHGDRTLVRTTRGEEVLADAVVAGLGIEPDTALARAAGLAVSDGIEVDERMRTSAPGVWAAGDVARFPSPLGARRVEHEDAAISSGRLAGLNMAGADERYEGLPFFYSDLFDLGYEAVGQLDARLETVVRWKTHGRQGVVYYLEGDRVRGVLLWGTFGQVDAARRLIERRDPPKRAELGEELGG